MVRDDAENTGRARLCRAYNPSYGVEEEHWGAIKGVCVSRGVALSDL